MGADVLLVEGGPGSGRTSVVQKLLSTLTRVRFVGFFSHSSSGEAGTKRLVLVRGRDREVVPRRLLRPAPHADAAVFDATSLHRAALPHLADPLDEAEVVVMDCLGRMEVSVPAVLSRVRELARGTLPLVLTTSHPPPPELERALAGCRIQRFQVTESNRPVLAQPLADALMEILERAGTAPGPGAEGIPQRTS